MIDPNVLARPDTPPPAASAPAHPRLQAVLILATIALLTFALYLYVLPNSQMSEAQARIAQLRAERDALSRQSAEMIRLAADFTMLTRIEKRAKELGMGPPRSIYFGTPAFREEPAESPPTEPRPPSPPVSSPASRWRAAVESTNAWLTARWRQTFE